METILLNLPECPWPSINKASMIGEARLTFIQVTALLHFLQTNYVFSDTLMLF